MNFGKQFKEGLITQNPVLVQVLGMCSTMAITTSFFNGIGMGVAVSLPSDRFARIGNLAWPGGRTANFAAFGSWLGVLPKNAESLRNSDALMRVTVPRRRGPAGLRDPVAAVRSV